MIFFIYLIIYQIFDTWYKEKKERYVGVGSFGNINIKRNSFFPFNCGIFSNLSSYKSTIQEGYENEIKEAISSRKVYYREQKFVSILEKIKEYLFKYNKGDSHGLFEYVQVETGLDNSEILSYFYKLFGVGINYRLMDSTIIDKKNGYDYINDDYTPSEFSYIKRNKRKKIRKELGFY
jgi:hypothetical protein